VLIDQFHPNQSERFIALALSCADVDDLGADPLGGAQLGGAPRIIEEHDRRAKSLDQFDDCR
jgi:hypothetical protein